MSYMSNLAIELVNLEKEREGHRRKIREIERKIHELEKLTIK